MTLIFYDRNFMALNEDLQEIKNREMLYKLKKDFLGNYSKFNSFSPYICGSLVNRGLSQKNFDRKLKMMKASVYTLLQLTQSRLFVETENQQKIIDDAVRYILVSESYNLLDQLDISDKLEGWDKFLEQKCH